MTTFAATSATSSTSSTLLTPAARREPRRPQSPAGGGRIVLALVRSTLLGFVREPISFVMEFLYPLFMLGIFHAVFPGELIAGVSYAEYLLPAMITTGIMTTCLQNLAVTVAGEREHGELRRLAVLPTPSWAHVVSKCVSNTILALLNTAALMAVGHYAMGIDLPGTARARGLPQSLQVVVLRVVQESLSNVARHASAGRVDVVVGVESVGAGVELVVTVTNNNVGTGARPEGTGLTGMRARVETVGGTLTVDPLHAPDAAGRTGTVVEARMPC